MPNKKREIVEEKKKGIKKRDTKIKKTVIKRKDSIRRQRENDAFMLSMLLSVTCLLATSLKLYQFTLFHQPLSFSLLIIPIVVFISNYITKKYGFKDSLNGIIISSLMLIAFLILIKDLTNQQIDFIELLENFVTYFISLFINLSIYYYIISNMLSNHIMIGLTYMFTMVLNSFLYLLFFHGLVVSNNFWLEFTISIVIQFIISFVLVFFDTKIKRGTEI